MLTVVLFFILLYQRINIDSIIRNRPNLDPQKARKRANLGLIGLGLISILNVTFNIALHRGWWNGDFFSPFFNGFKV
jgi:hypothetical protein